MTAHCHEIAKREQRIGQLEAEVQRLGNIISEQADTISRQRAILVATPDWRPVEIISSWERHGDYDG